MPVPGEQSPWTAPMPVGQLLDALGDAVLLLDAAGRVQHANPVACALLGYAAPDLLGRSAADLVAEPPGWFATEFARLLVAGAWQGEVALRRADGALLAAEIRSSAIHLPPTTLYTTVLRDVTERRRMEAALRAGETRFRSLVGSMEDVVFTLDRELRMTGVYGRWLQRFGLVADMFIGRTAPQVFPAEAARRHEAAARRALGGETVTYEWERIEPDGSRAAVQTVLSPQHGPAGEVTGLVGVGRDITALRRAQQALRAEEERLRLALDAAGLGAWEVETASGAITWSDHLGPLLGHAPAAAPTDAGAVLAQVPEPQRADVEQALERVLRSGGEFAVECPVVHPDGSVHWLAVRGRAPVGESGRPARLLGVTRDVTARREADEALRWSLERLAEAQRIGRMGSWEWDIAHQRVNWSAEHFRIFGLEPGAPPPTLEAFMELIHPEDRDGARAVIEDALRSGRPFEFDYRLAVPGAGARVFHARGDVFRGPDGRPERLAGTSQDVTEQRQAERDRAERARLEGVLLAARTMQHEVNNKLTATLGFAQLLADDPDLPAHLREAAEAAARGAQAAGELVRRLRELSRIRERDWGPDQQPTLDLSRR